MRIDTALFSRNCGRGPGRLHRGAGEGRSERGGRETGRGRERWRETKREARRERETDGETGEGWAEGSEVQREGLGGGQKEKARERGESHGDKETERKRLGGHFPGGPGAKTPGSHGRAAGRAGWIPGQGTENPPAARCKGSERGRERDEERRETWEDKAQRDDGVERKRRTEV